MFKQFKKIFAMLLIVIMLTVNISLTFSQPVSANPLSTLREVQQQVQQSIPNIDWQQVKQAVPNIDWQRVKQAVPNIDPQQVQQAISKINFQQVQQSFSGKVEQIVSQIDPQHIKQGLTDNALFLKVGQVIANTNNTVIANTKKYLETTPEQLCHAYSDYKRGINNSQWQTLQKSAISTYTIFQSVSSASAAGAGALSGYAGIASAVSQLGLGGLTTSLAGLLGSSVTGAAATSVVTSFVGGPMVMAALLVGGTTAATWGTYKTIEFTSQQFDSLAEEFCN